MSESKGHIPRNFFKSIIKPKAWKPFKRPNYSKKTSKNFKPLCIITKIRHLILSLMYAFSAVMIRWDNNYHLYKIWPSTHDNRESLINPENFCWTHSGWIRDACKVFLGTSQLLSYHVYNLRDFWYSWVSTPWIITAMR